MKNTLLLFFALTLGFQFANAQSDATLEETITWINSKLESYTPINTSEKVTYLSTSWLKHHRSKMDPYNSNSYVYQKVSILNGIPYLETRQKNTKWSENSKPNGAYYFNQRRYDNIYNVHLNYLNSENIYTGSNDDGYYIILRSLKSKDIITKTATKWSINYGVWYKYQGNYKDTNSNVKESQDSGISKKVKESSIEILLSDIDVRDRMVKAFERLIELSKEEKEKQRVASGEKF